ncbi:MAG: hypothetical protein H7Y88_00400 [Phycisphaerales bacterium]|nr:hypothetical protein [Phycisphaerales bacterium]
MGAGAAVGRGRLDLWKGEARGSLLVALMLLAMGVVPGMVDLLLWHGNR